MLIMSSTVTTTTVTTIAMTFAFAGSLSLVGILTLLILVVKKEVASSGKNPRLVMLNRVLSIALVPLALAVVAIIAVQVGGVF
jgi:hypothetical protein